MERSKYKVGIIVTWFGNLPDYFPAWLLSAEQNKDIDFLCFCDHEIQSNSENIKYYPMTLEESIKMFEKKLDRKINIVNSYKFCDCRAFFGITYSDYLQDYDYWGYCDIDLVFGNIRHFLTDEVLEKHERFYQYGHLSVFKNNYKMNHLYDLPGGIYTYDEIFCGKAKTTPEEYLGINRICEKNKISWYINVDFADFVIKYPNRLELKHGLQNSDNQIFIWTNGCAYQVVKTQNQIEYKELVYMHWQKRKPCINGELHGSKVLVLTGNSIDVYDSKKEVEELDFGLINPMVSQKEKKIFQKNYRLKKLKDFLKSDLPTKKMWLRQKRYMIFEKNRTYK